MTTNPLNPSVWSAYPKIAQYLVQFPEAKIESLTGLFIEIEQDVKKISSSLKPIPGKLLQAKWLHERFETINAIFDKVSDYKKRDWLDTLAQRDCRPGLLLTCENFISSRFDISGDAVVPYLIEQMKGNIIQEIVTSDQLISSTKEFHTVNVMNLLIKEKGEYFGISNNDMIYKQALADDYTLGVKREIEYLMGMVDEFYNALIDKFSSVYTKERLINFSKEYINDLNRKLFRRDLMNIFLKKLEPRTELWENITYGNDLSNYIQKVCIKDESVEYEISDQGIEFLFEEEFVAIQEPLRKIERVVNQDGLALKNLSEKWRCHPKITEAAIRQNPQALQYVHCDVATPLIKGNSSLLKYAQQDVALPIINENLSLLQYADQALASLLIYQNHSLLKYAHDDVAESFVNANPTFLFYVCDNFALNMIKTNRSLLQYANPDFVLSFIENDATSWPYVASSERNNQKFIVSALKKNAEVMKYLTYEMQLDKTFLLTILKENPEVMNFLPPVILEDKLFILNSLRKNAAVQKYLPHDIFCDNDYILTAIAANDYQFLSSAVSKNPAIIKSLPDKLLDNRKFLLDTLKMNSEVMKFLTRTFNDKEFILDALKLNATVIQFLPIEVFNDKTFVMSAVDKAPNILAYIPEPWKNDKNFVSSLVNGFAFGKEKWEHFFGTIGDVPSLNDDIVNILCSDDPYDLNEPRKKVFETHMLFLIPSTVNGENLNLLTFRQLIKTTSSGNQTDYDFISKEVIHAHGLTTPISTYWALMTKDVIPGSRNLPYEIQKKAVIKMEGYTVPDLLSATIGIVTHYVRTRECLFSNTLGTLTRCSDTTGKYQSFVGNFLPTGINLPYRNFDHQTIGVAALKAFF